MIEENKKNQDLELEEENAKSTPILLDAVKGARMHITMLSAQNAQKDADKIIVDIANAKLTLNELESQKVQLDLVHTQSLALYRQLIQEFELPLSFNFTRNDDDSYTIIEKQPNC